MPQYQPQTLHVPSDYSTIQVALSTANETDTILVQWCIYTENIIWPETNGIKPISAGDSSNTIIDGGGLSSVIYMNPQSATIDTTTLIQGFKITNGGGIDNGGLFISNASPKIIQNLVDGNFSLNGSGLYLSETQAVIKNNKISNNSAAENGGGIYISIHLLT